MDSVGIYNIGGGVGNKTVKNGSENGGQCWSI